MVALSSLTQRLTAVPGKAATAAGADTDGGFARALAALDGDADAPAAPLERQDDAAPGKAPPDPAPDLAASPALDPRLLWLPPALLSPVPVVPAPIATKPATAVAEILPPLSSADTLTAPVAVTKPTADATSSAKALERLALGDAAPQDALAALFRDARNAAPPIAGTVVALPPPIQPVPVAALPEAIAALGLDPATRDDRKKLSTDPVAPAVTMTTEVALQNAVQPTGETRHVPLDLRGDAGLQKMIDHIETLRDGADANDTRIRLVPDALGTVDVAVRREGADVHVHFTAENADTRTLLTEAQPRLIELAEQRGVRIAGASVDTGAGGGGSKAQPQRQPQARILNRISTTTIEATGDDARLA